MNTNKTKIIITEYETKQTKEKYLFTGLFTETRLIEAHFDRKTKPSILGNIYIGRVQKIVKNLNAAFIEIQPGVNGYYPLEQCKAPVYIKKINSPSMVQGDEVLVQIAKENLKTKLPVLSTNLNLTGKYCVLTSENKKLGVSAKIGSEKRKELTALFKDRPTGDFGIIVRTNAKNASAEDILKEYKALKEEFERILYDGKYRTCFSCLKKSIPEYLKVLQNIYYGQLTEIITDLPEICEEISEFKQGVSELDQVPVRLYDDKLLSLSALYNIEKQLERALAKKVWLPSGGYLIIEPTEALTVIDVNTGKSVAKKHPQEHFLAVNKEAAREAAAQLRLRNISGIIIIDFIDLKSKDAKKELLQYLTEAVKNDPVPVQVIDMTKLDLVELTRKKVSKSLPEQLT